MPERGVALDHAPRDIDGLVGGVVEQLDIQFIFRIFHPADGFDQPVDHVLLVEKSAAAP